MKIRRYNGTSWVQEYPEVNVSAIAVSNPNNASSTTFLRGDGAWAVPPGGTDTNNYLTGVSGSGDGTVTFTRSGLSNLTWDASHTHSEYLPLTGGTLTGTLTSRSIAMQNNNLTGVGYLQFNDPGPNEGIDWSNGNFKIYESPNDLTTNSAGNLQFVSGGSRRLTVDTSGNVDIPGGSLSVSDNVAIGTTTASYDLDVRGEIRGFNYRVDDYIRHTGDDDTYIRMVGGDDMQLVAGGRQMLRLDEGTDPDKLRFVTDNDWTNSNGDWNMSGEVTVGDRIRLYTESGTAQIADTFADTTTFKSYIYFDQGTSSNDPGFIMHETSDSETNEGVLHLVPSDDNSYGDYVSIHGTNDPDKLKLHTDGTIDGVTNITLSGDITVGGTVDGVDIAALNTTVSGKANTASPALTGTPTAPTAAANTNTTQIATTAYVQGEITDLINGANASFDTLKEIQDAMATDTELSDAIAGLTIGNGTQTISVGAGLDGGGSFTANQTGNSSISINLDLSEFTDMTADVVGSQDELILLDSGAERRKLISEIKLGQFNNDSGWTSNTGTVTSVATGGGLTGGTITGSGTISHADTSSQASVNNSGRTYIQDITLDTYGHITGITSATETVTDTVYTHPTHPGDDISIDTGALTGATVISDLDFNVTSDTLGHITDANATVSTRNLTASDIGAAASNHSHSNYVATSGDTMTGDLTMDHDGESTANDSHGINFTGRFLSTDFVNKLYMDSGANLKFGTNTIFHSGNDGSSSGLHADLLDGQQGSYYLDYNNFTNTPTDSDTVTQIRKDNTGTYRTGNINLVGGSGVTITETASGVFSFAAAGGGATYSSATLYIKRIWSASQTSDEYTLRYNAGTGTGTAVSTSSTYTSISLGYTPSSTDKFMIELSNNTSNSVEKGICFVGYGTFSSTAGMSVISYDAYETVASGQLKLAKYFCQWNNSGSSMRFRYGSKMVY